MSRAYTIRTVDTGSAFAGPPFPSFPGSRELTFLETCSNRWGTNWRVLAVLLIVVPPELPGLLFAISKSVVIPLGMQRFYRVSWLFGTCATLMYVVPAPLPPSLRDNKAHLFPRCS